MSKGGSIWAKVALFGQIVAFGAKCFYLCNGGCTWTKVVVFGQNGCIWAKVVLFGQTCFYMGKMVVLGQKWFNLGKGDCIWGSGSKLTKVVVFGKRVAPFGQRRLYLRKGGCT